MFVVQFEQQVIQSRYKWIITNNISCEGFLTMFTNIHKWFVRRLTTICTVARHTVRLRVSPKIEFFINLLMKRVDCRHAIVGGYF